MQTLEQTKAEREARQREFNKRLFDWATGDVKWHWIGDYARPAFREVEHAKESMRTDIISRHRSAALAWALKLNGRIICKLAGYAGKHNDTSDWEETRRSIFGASDSIWHRLFPLDVDLEWFQVACDPPPMTRRNRGVHPDGSMVGLRGFPQTMTQNPNPEFSLVVPASRRLSRLLNG